MTTITRQGNLAGNHHPPRRSFLRARYDAAQTTEENRRHWAAADGLSPDASLNSEVRQVLRNRCRYEVANNSYAKGIGLTIANDTISTGPMLQLIELDKATKKVVETLFWEWAQEIGLADKLRQMRFARFDSGEAFTIFRTNPGLMHPIKLDLQIVEGEQIADPSFESIVNPNVVDGIYYDDFGNPISYRKLRKHPGSHAWLILPTEYDDIPARFVWHYFRSDRPGQCRGIPDITPAIQLFAELRRYCAAVIAAAETAADFAAVLQSDAPPTDEEDVSEEVAAFDTVELAKRMGTVLPGGYKLGQLEAEQPTTTYPDFVDAKLKEIARCLCVPFHIASMDPKSANMSSSYVVGQLYVQERIVDRSVFDMLLDKAFASWLSEARLIPNFLPELPDLVPHEWFWPGLGHHADPQKVANATTTDLSSGITNIPREHARRGLDWEEQQELAAKSLGVSVDEYREMIRNKLFGPQQPQESQKIEENTDE